MNDKKQQEEERKSDTRRFVGDWDDYTLIEEGEETEKKENLLLKAYDKNLYIKDGLNYYRTQPNKKGSDIPYKAFIKLPEKEKEISIDSVGVLDALLQGDEITKDIYKNIEVEIPNKI